MVAGFGNRVDEEQWMGCRLLDCWRPNRGRKVPIAVPGIQIQIARTGDEGYAPDGGAIHFNSQGAISPDVFYFRRKSDPVCSHLEFCFAGCQGVSTGRTQICL